MCLRPRKLTPSRVRPSARGRAGHRAKRPGSEGGFALVVLLVIMVAGGTFIFLRNWSTPQANLVTEEASRMARDIEVLDAAKQHLIMFSAYYDQRKIADESSQDVIGILPCPDSFVDGVHDGQQPGFCSLTGETNLTFGWFPYKYLTKAFAGAEDPVVVDEVAFNSQVFSDAFGEPIWYAVAQSHRYGAAGTRNSDLGTSEEDLHVDGKGDYVAVLIAPGPSLDATGSTPIGSAHCTAPWQTFSMLSTRFERENGCYGNANFAKSGTALSFAASTEGFNDAVVTVSRQELNAALEQRVLAELSNYYARLNKNNLPELLPFLSSVSPHDPCLGVPDLTGVTGVPVWLTGDWLDQKMVIVAYGPGMSTASGTICTDPIRVRKQDFDTRGELVETEVTVDIAILIAGRMLSSLAQDRYAGSPDLEDYFELANAASSEGVEKTFVAAHYSETFNDQVVGIACDESSCQQVVAPL